MESSASEGVGLSTPSRAEGHAPFVHSAAVLASRDEMLDVSLAFVDEGLRDGDLTVLATGPETAEEIRRRLGWRAEALEDDARMGLLAVRAPDGVAAVRRVAQRAGGSRSGRARVLAEPQYAATPDNCREGIRYEAASNALLTEASLTGLCVYDATAFDHSVLDAVPATHPTLFVDGEHRANPAFQDPRSFLHGLPVPREPVEEAPPVLVVEAVPRLPSLRHAVKAALDERVRDEEQRADLYLAVSEIAANAFRHGSRPVSARVWADERRIVVTVTDAGHGFDDPLAGFAPAHGDDLSQGGMGLWLARKLWDSVDLVLGEQGLTVRLATGLR